MRIPIGEGAFDDTAAPRTTEAFLTDEFYRWELWGRGWQVWDVSVRLEPPFRPFLWHTVPTLPAGALRDDARRPTRVGAFFERLRRRLTGNGDTVPVLLPDDEEPLPETDETADDLVELLVTVPPDVRLTKDRAERFLLVLSSLAYPAAFEVVGREDAIEVALTCRLSDAPELRSALRAYFPEAAVREERDWLRGAWEGNAARPAVVVDFGLSREFMVPLKAAGSFDVDPLIAVAGALSDLRAGELGVFQVLFQATRHPWAPSIVRAVTDGEGDPFFVDAPEILAMAEEKVAHPLFAAVVRVAAQAPTADRAWEIARALGGSLAQFRNPVGNEFIPLTNDDYPDGVHAEGLLSRKTRRSGMLLSADELGSLVHLPSASVQAEGLSRAVQKTKAAPASGQRDGIVLGENVHRGKTVTIRLDPGLRTRHTYVIGASGTGKSTLLLNMLVQDIDRGEGVGLIDPHGDLVDAVLARIPEGRCQDVVLFDPSDADYPVGFNILEARSELERNLLASDLVVVFRRFSSTWGDQMTAVLGNAILAFLENDRGGTLLDLRRFLIEPEFRRSVLATVTDPEVTYYFQKEFSLLRGRPAAPLLTRLDAFLRPKLIRYMVGQRRSALDLRAVMDGRRIFLAKLAHGLVGEENSYLLGALLVAKFYELALARQAQAEGERTDFYLYIDEFHHFATPSLATLLSGARKYHLGLTLAHQELKQLAEREPALTSAVLTNPATRICFRVGTGDARALAPGFASFKPEDLENLGVGEAIGRFDRRDADFTLRTRLASPVDDAVAEQRREEILRCSRVAWARPRGEVEAELAATLGHGTQPVRDREPTTTEAVAAEPPRPPSPRVTPPASPASEALPSRAEDAPAPASAHVSSAPRATAVPPSGRGGREHKYLQHLVKRLAEDRGWRATVEAEALGGLGQVDVALERDGYRIAGEITVTTSDEHEVANIQKCLAAGYDEVVVVANQKKGLRSLERHAAEAFSAESVERVRFLSPEELVAYLDEKDATASRTQTVRGYKVRVNYKPVSAAEAKTRKDTISRVLAQGLRTVRH